jgi:hypothetical protein
MQFISKIRECLPRQEERFATFAAVEIMTLAGALVGKATLRDISTTGGFMRKNKAQRLPDRFTMWIPKLGRSVDASIQWRSAEEMGVRFDAEVNLDVFKSRLEDRAMRVAGYFAPKRIAA